MKRLAIVAVVALGLLLSLSSAEAQSEPTCAFNGLEHTVTVTVDGDPATLSTSSRAIRLNGVQCGTATVDNTDSIVVNGGALADTVTVSGSYKPGFTAETDGSSEIEFTFSLAGGLDTFKLNGTSQSDVIPFTQGGIDIGNDGDQDVTTASGVEIIRVYGKNGNDTIDATDYPWTGVHLYGGNGDDTLIGTGLSDSLYGNAGADALQGGVGNDQLYGGSEDDLTFGEDGDDTMWADATADGADEYYGGAGADTLTYQKRTGALTVTIGNGLADDGEAGELDLVDFDVENVTGGAGSDTLSGTTASNVLTGGAGDDTIDGLGGDDTVSGGDGIDTLTGGSGNDSLTGGAGDDDLNSGTGNDTVFGDADNDIIRGTAGDDELHGGPGNDTLYGGDGTDVFYADAGIDVIYASDGIPENVACGAGVDTVYTGGDGGVLDACEDVH